MKNLRKVETCASCEHLKLITDHGAGDSVCTKDDGFEWIDEQLPNDVYHHTDVVCDDWTPRVKTCGTCVDFRPETNTCHKDDSGEIIDPNDPHDCEIWQLAESEDDEL